MKKNCERGLWLLLNVSVMFLFFSFFYFGYQVPSEIVKENGSHLLVNDQNKYRSMWTRIYSSIWMIGGFVLIIYMGHLYIWGMVVVIQIFMAKELFNLLRKAHEDSHLPGFRLLNWYVNQILVIFNSQLKFDVHLRRLLLYEAQ